MKKSVFLVSYFLLLASATAGVRLENRFVTLEIGDDATITQLTAKDTGAALAAGKVPFVGAVMRDGSFVPAVKATGDDRTVDFDLANGGKVRLLVTSFGDGWMFETRKAALKGAKELRFVRVKALADDKHDVLVRAAHIRTALRDDDGVGSAAALCGWGFNQHRAILAAAPKAYGEKLLHRISLIGGKETVREAGPWAENIVANPAIEVPESWHPKKIAGRDFRAKFSELLVAHFGGMSKLPDCTAYRHAIIHIVGHMDVRDFGGRDFRSNPKKRKTPYTIEDVLSTTTRAKEIYTNISKYPDMLFTASMGIRPLFTLISDDFGADVEGFRRWRTEHPQFLGFRGYSEADTDFSGFFANAVKTIDAKKGEGVAPVVVPDEVLAKFPITGDRITDFDRYMRAVWPQLKKVYFDSDEIYGLFTINLGTCHKLAQVGVKILECEVAINGTAAPWAWSGGFLRGAARQWNRIPSWYMARYFHNSNPTREGIDRGGDQSWPRAIRPNFQPYLGGGRSINRRGMFYGWAMGASVLDLEGEALFSLEDGPDGKNCVMSIYAREFNDIFELAERVDRGVAYTPVALVGSIDEYVARHGHPMGAMAPYAHSAFLYTLVPVNSEALHHSAREKGDQGAFRNSHFGEIWDYVTCDSGQDRATFVKALSRYPVAFLVGKVNEKAFDAKGMEEYVENGGTLFVTADNVKPGLVEPSFAGVTYGKKKVPFKIGKFSYTAVKPSETTADTSFFDVSFAPTNAHLFTSRSVGKGKIITCAVERYLPDFLRKAKFDKNTDVEKPTGWIELVSGKVDFPLVRELLTKVQGETVPFEIRGRCQWGVNKTARGWFVWLMNNDGVTKYATEPESLDFGETSRVTVISKLTGESKTVEIEPGGTAFLEF